MNIKYYLGKLLLNLGGFGIMRIVSRKIPKILMYHRFSEATQFAKVGQQEFEQQLKYLLKHHNIVPLSLLVDSKLSNQVVTKNAVAITVDDGYEDFYRYAFPLLKKYSCSATLFVTTGFVDGLCWLWPDVLDFTLLNCQPGSYEISIPGDPKRIQLNVDAQSHDTNWKKLSIICLSLTEENKKHFLHEILRKFNVVLPDQIPEQYKPCSWDQLREMADHGIELGSHTVNHPSMGKVSCDAIAYELVESKKRLEQELNKPIDLFCYPNGMHDDYNKNVMDEVKKTGFKAAFVAYHDGLEGVGAYEIRRFGVGGDIYHFQKAVNGVLHLSAKIKRNLTV